MVVGWLQGDGGAWFGSTGDVGEWSGLGGEGESLAWLGLVALFENGEACVGNYRTCFVGAVGGRMEFDGNSIGEMAVCRLWVWRK